MLLVLGTVGVVVYSRRPGDLAGYLAVGDAVLSGRHIYRDVPPGINTWPPFFSLLCVPLSVAARPTPVLARVLWILLNYAALALAVRSIVRMLNGIAIERGRGETESTRIALTATLLTLPYVLSNLEHLQINIILFALTLGGLERIRARRERSGAIAIALAAAIKIMPMAFLPYLLARGRWRTAAWLGAGFAGWSLSPAVIYGWRRYLDYLDAWREALALGWGAGTMNQSVLAMWDRWLGHGLVPFQDIAHGSLPASGTPAARIAWAGSLLLVVVASAWTLRTVPRESSLTVTTEWSVVFLIAALFAPVTWKAYLVILMLPMALLVAAWGDRSLSWARRAVLRTTVATSTMFTWLTAGELWGRELTLRFATASVATWSGVVAIAGLLALVGIKKGGPERPRHGEALPVAPGQAAQDLLVRRGIRRTGARTVIAPQLHGVPPRP